jgi:hypothetical protein
MTQSQRERRVLGRDALAPFPDAAGVFD